jgi:hypothetical protein
MYQLSNRRREQARLIDARSVMSPGKGEIMAARRDSIGPA